MGLLAENKSRSKISKDPNNTKWTRDTSGFGRKILHAQGWRPGQYLGAENAAHSSLHTAANASFIRVSVKDDMKGLGFDKAKEDKVTGLDVFSDLLSRLNGKSKEAIEGEKLARLAIKTNWYVERKWGPMRFVNGGLLVGENIIDNVGKESSPSPEQIIEPRASICDASKEQRTKKRKNVDVEDGNEDAETIGTSIKKKGKEKGEKREKGEKKEKRDKRNKRDGKEKKDKEGKKKDKGDSGKYELPSNDATSGDDRGQASLKHEEEQEAQRLERKESGFGSAEDDKLPRRKKHKKAKEKKKEKKRDTNTGRLDDATVEPKSPQLLTQNDSSAPAKASSTPVPPKGGRNFARSRFIAAKRQAMLDTNALNQIFMVKA
ncbi:hypothetical protein CDD81_4940 [Ophiocordyceps australis]|uniref:G-patch domain-containing protein n=1 Tax=Ophiocordyceps australis TaxID=1399860 RepID=A0A2C5Y992_9HYPO|nr:hypothetical protein CDD81_4940 [Ophiocordyceps australis]